MSVLQQWNKPLFTKSSNWNWFSRFWGRPHRVWEGHKNSRLTAFWLQKSWKQYNCHRKHVMKKKNVILAAIFRKVSLRGRDPTCDNLYIMFECKYQKKMMIAAMVWPSDDSCNGLTIPSPRHKLGNHGFTTEVPTAAAFLNALQWIVMKCFVMC